MNEGRKLCWWRCLLTSPLCNGAPGSMCPRFDPNTNSCRDERSLSFIYSCFFLLIFLWPLRSSRWVSIITFQVHAVAPLKENGTREFTKTIMLGLPSHSHSSIWGFCLAMMETPDTPGTPHRFRRSRRDFQTLQMKVCVCGGGVKERLL